MRLTYLSRETDLESLFPNRRPVEAFPNDPSIPDYGVKPFHLEADKEGKFYILNDLRDTNLHGQDIPKEMKDGCVCVQEFDSENERAEEIKRFQHACARLLKSQSRSRSVLVAWGKGGKKDSGEEGGNAVPARVRPKPPVRSGSDAKPIPRPEP